MLTGSAFRTLGARRRVNPTDSSPYSTSFEYATKMVNSYLLTPLLSILGFSGRVSEPDFVESEPARAAAAGETRFTVTSRGPSSIRLSMTGAQEQIQALARDLVARPRRPATFRTSTTDIMQGHPGDPLHELVHEPAAAALAQYRAGVRPASRQAQRHADGRSRAKPRSPKLHSTRRAGLFAAHLRRPRQRLHHAANAGARATANFFGPIAAVFSVEGILTRRHSASSCRRSTRSRSSTRNNRELTTTSTRPRLPRDMFYDLPLDPPGRGVSVRVYAFPQMTNFTNSTARRGWWLGLVVLRVVEFVEPSGSTRGSASRRKQALYAEAFFRRAMENSGARSACARARHARPHHALLIRAFLPRCDRLGRKRPRRKTAPFAYWPARRLSGNAAPARHGAARRGAVVEFELRVRRKDGSPFHARLVCGCRR